MLRESGRMMARVTSGSIIIHGSPGRESVHCFLGSSASLSGRSVQSVAKVSPKAEALIFISKSTHKCSRKQSREDFVPAGQKAIMVMDPRSFIIHQSSVVSTRQFETSGKSREQSIHFRPGLVEGNPGTANTGVQGAVQGGPVVVVSK